MFAVGLLDSVQRDFGGALRLAGTVTAALAFGTAAWRIRKRAGARVPWWSWLLAAVATALLWIGNTGVVRATFVAVTIVLFLTAVAAVGAQARVPWLSAQAPPSPSVKPVDPDQEAKEQATRKVKDALNEVFHSRGRAAYEKALSVTDEMTKALIEMPEPYHTLGQFAESLLVREAKSAHDQLRTTLEGVAWDMNEGSDDASFRRFVYEMDVRRQSPSQLQSAFLQFYSQYKLLISGTIRLARILGHDLESNPRFYEWRSLDDQFTEKIRDALGMREMEDARDEFELWVKLGPEKSVPKVLRDPPKRTRPGWSNWMAGNKIRRNVRTGYHADLWIKSTDLSELDWVQCKVQGEDGIVYKGPTPFGGPAREARGRWEATYPDHFYDAPKPLPGHYEVVWESLHNDIVASDAFDLPTPKDGRVR